MQIYLLSNVIVNHNFVYFNLEQRSFQNFSMVFQNDTTHDDGCK